MTKTLYHGSDKIIEKPLFGVGKEDNDYGSGFYTTEDIEKAREWAWINGSNQAICNIYKLELSGLKILELDNYGTLAWIAEVVKHRGAKTAVADEIGNLLVDKYKIDTSWADIIIGYRADDSYISVVEAFLNNQLSLDEVERFFKKGDLGQQVFIQSEKAFDTLKFVGYETVSASFSSNYGNADIKARQEVNKFLNNRQRAIQIEGYNPTGITAREAISHKFVYDKEYGYYISNATENQNTIGDNFSQDVKPVCKKGKSKYDLEL